MNAEQAQILLAISEALAAAVKDDLPWKAQANQILRVMQSCMDVERPTLLNILAHIWKYETNPERLGEVYPSYGFLKGVLKAPLLLDVRWDEHKMPLPMYKK
jgi:hypothetical protein